MRHIFSTVLLLIAVSLAAFHSEPFPLGTYSYLQNNKNFYRPNRDAIITGMQELGYNITVIETFNGDDELPRLLKALDRAQIDAVLTDKCWSNEAGDPRNYGIVALATSNYHRFEAEFDGKAPVINGDEANSSYWYAPGGTITRSGTMVYDPKASYHRAWYLNRDKHEEGWAFTDINYRWPDRNGNTIKPYNEIRFHNKHFGNRADTDSLRITFRLKIDNIKEGLPLTAPLFHIEVYGHTEKGNSFEKRQIARKSDLRKAGDTALFTLASYYNQGAPAGFFDFHYAISYDDLRAAGIMTNDLNDNPANPTHWWWHALRHFAPGLYWHKNSDLSLDYIDFEDQLHYELRTKAADYKKGINSRIRSFVGLDGGNTIRYIYGMDEPYQTHLHSFKFIREMIDEELPPLISATYDIHYKKFKMADGQWWDYPSMVRDIAQPKVMMPDVYPITPNVVYSPSGGENFLQNVLDERLLAAYQRAKDYTALSSERLFYPVLQTFGAYSGSSWISWMLPPKATQKALLFLPFCYGPDGIFHYQFVAPSSYYAPYLMAGNSMEKLPYVHQLLKEQNPRQKAIGEMLLAYKWLSSSTLMDELKDKDSLPQSIAALAIVDKKKADYYGYIQLGNYTNAAGEEAFIVVNRRTDKFVADKDIAEERKLPPDKYEAYYHPYPAQKIQITFEKGIKKPALIDMETGKIYKAKGRKLKLTLDAGEAMLLKIVR